MDAMTCSAARANLARTMDRVCEDHEPLIITRNGKQSVVMLSLEDYLALEATAYFLRSPANASRLLASVAHAGIRDRSAGIQDARLPQSPPSGTLD